MLLRRGKMANKSHFPSLTKWQLCKNGQWVAPPSPMFRIFCVRRGDPYSDFLGCSSMPLNPTGVPLWTVGLYIPIHDGDNQKGEAFVCSACSETYSLRHSDPSPGIYNAKLTQESYSFGTFDGSKFLEPRRLPSIRRKSFRPPPNKSPGRKVAKEPLHCLI